MADLRAILSQGRKRIGLLVGAGAPVGIRVDSDHRLDPGGASLIPDVAGLTVAVVNALPARMRATIEGIRQDISSVSNIEAILSRVKLLERAVGNSTLNGLDKAGYRELGKAICNSIGDRVKARLPEEPTGYSELVSWIAGTARPHPVEIFTTNYDLLFEEAFERVRRPYFDGFTGGQLPFFDAVTVAGGDLPPRWTRLWKMHGSLGWALENGNVVRTGSRDATELIYPDHLKYDLIQRQPYSALFERLKQFLLQPDTLLLTTGFSFSDAHVCAVLDEALTMNSNATIFAFQFGKLVNEICALELALKHPNMSIYARDAAVVRGVPGPWKPGELPNRQWEEIRKSFWNTDPAGSGFTLGDFGTLARFCALSRSLEVRPADDTRTDATSAGGVVAAEPSPAPPA